MSTKGRNPLVVTRHQPEPGEVWLRENPTATATVLELLPGDPEQPDGLQGPRVRARWNDGKELVCLVTAFLYNFTAPGDDFERGVAWERKRAELARHFPYAEAFRMAVEKVKEPK